ncbi:hypothetical protein V8C40DRAFT_243320 [Trichoderma camerunense]
MSLASHLDPHIRGVEATFSSTGQNQRTNYVHRVPCFCLSFNVDNSASKTAPMRRHLAPDDATQTVVKAAAIVNSANHTAHNCWCAGDFPRWTSHESIPLHEERWASLERHLIPPVCVCIGCNPAGSPAYLTRCV